MAEEAVSQHDTRHHLTKAYPSSSTRQHLRFDSNNNNNDIIDMEDFDNDLLPCDEVKVSKPLLKRVEEIFYETESGVESQEEHATKLEGQIQDFEDSDLTISEKEEDSSASEVLIINETFTHSETKLKRANNPKFKRISSTTFIVDDYGDSSSDDNRELYRVDYRKKLPQLLRVCSWQDR